MNVINFGQAGCERVRRYLDSHIDGELLIETNHEILRHLEACPSCASECQRRIRLRERVRSAVRADAAPPELASRVRQSIRTRRWPVWRGLLAASVLVALLGGWFGVRYWQRHIAQETLFDRVSAHISQVLRAGLGDHIHCAVFRRYPKKPPALEKFEDELGKPYAGIVRLAAERVSPRYSIVLAHWCSHRGRRFAHLVLTDGGSIASLAITDKRRGESFERLTPLSDESGVPLYGASADRFEIVAFETASHLAYFVSDLPARENLELAASFVPALHGFLSAQAAPR